LGVSVLGDQKGSGTSRDSGQVSGLVNPVVLIEEQIGIKQPEGNNQMLLNNGRKVAKGVCR
jgi:hypothetical protein